MVANPGTDNRQVFIITGVKEVLTFDTLPRPAPQVRLPPLLLRQFLPHQSLRLGFPALLTFHRVVLCFHSLQGPCPAVPPSAPAAVPPGMVRSERLRATTTKMVSPTCLWPPETARTCGTGITTTIGFTVQCEGRVSNRSAIGTKMRVRATIQGRTYCQMREISNGDGWSGNSLDACFGPETG